MASIDSTFQQVLNSFTDRLTGEELEDFKVSSFKDLEVAILSIQEEQGRRLEMMNLARIQRFLEAMDMYVTFLAGW